MNWRYKASIRALSSAGFVEIRVVCANAVGEVGIRFPRDVIGQQKVDRFRGTIHYAIVGEAHAKPGLSIKSGKC